MPLCEQTIESNFHRAKAIEDAIIQDVEAKGYDEEAVFALRLSLEEALTNAIRHGNQGARHKSVHVSYQVTSEFVEIEIADEGEGFTPGDVPDPTAADKLDIPSGRGILLMRAYMDVVQYNTKGNCIHLIKYNRQQPKSNWAPETTGQLAIAVADYERHTVLSLSGAADMAETQALAKLLDGLIDDGHIDLVLDLSHLDFVCSMGLGVLIKTQNRCRRQKGNLALVGPPPPVMRVLKTTRLTDLFKICPTVQAALNLKCEEEKN